MRAIRVAFHGPTDSRGSRYSATDEDGSRVIVEALDSLSLEQNRDRAAWMLCKKMGWTHYNLMRGGLGRGWVYTFEADHNRVRMCDVLTPAEME